jgi:hypothetical protein
MSTALMLISGVLLGAIAWQDFHERVVSVWLLALLAMTELLLGCLRSGLESLLWQTAQNAVITFSLLIIVWIYVIVKNRKWMNLFKNGFGSADLILLLILGMFFSPFIFVLFMLTGFILTLVFSLFIRLANSSGEKTIPLAGYLAGWTILVMILIVIFPQYPPDNDGWLMLLLTTV